MSNKFRILLYCCCTLLTCHGAIWETDDAYIIDDLPEDDTLPVATTESTNVCVDSSGARGQCIPFEECSPYYKFFTSPEAESKLGILNGLHRYLNQTDTEPCDPTNQDDTLPATTTPVYYVCCTSLKYAAGVRSITLDDYNAKYSNQVYDEPLPEIPLATNNSTEKKVVNGEEAGIGEFPFQVALMVGRMQFCGGSLIDSLWVLTAAHCFDKVNKNNVRQLSIKIGYHNIRSPAQAGQQDISVSKLFIHKGFPRTGLNRNFRDDVALIKLKSPVSPGGNIRTIALHSGVPNINTPYIDATVCGWGKTCGADGCPTSSVLRKTKLPLIGNSECGRRYAGVAPPITQNMVCAGGMSGKDACNGDSGGPLLIYSGGQTIQIGIVSWGIGCGQYPGVYTRVSSYTSWVSKQKQK